MERRQSLWFVYRHDFVPASRRFLSYPLNTPTLMSNRTLPMPKACFLSKHNRILSSCTLYNCTFTGRTRRADEASLFLFAFPHFSRNRSLVFERTVSEMPIDIFQREHDH